MHVSPPTTRRRQRQNNRSSAARAARLEARRGCTIGALKALKQLAYDPLHRARHFREDSATSAAWPQPSCRAPDSNSYASNKDCASPTRTARHSLANGTPPQKTGSVRDFPGCEKTSTPRSNVPPLRTCSCRPPNGDVVLAKQKTPANAMPASFCDGANGHHHAPSADEILRRTKNLRHPRHPRHTAGRSHSS